jgi:hypothetical protein
MTASARDRTEHVLIDAIVVATPVADPGLAVQLGPGRLAVSARLADDDVQAPTVPMLRSDRNADPGASLDMPVAREWETGTVDLAGGVYSLRLHVNDATPEDATLGEIRTVTQFVELRIVYAPR